MAEAAKLGEKNWYIINTYSMHEQKTADNIRKRIASMGMENEIFRVLVVEVEEPVLKDGIQTGKTKVRNLYPGYIFVEMIMTDKSWYIVRNTPGVTGIAGSSGGGQKPTPVPIEQMEPVLKRMGMVDESMFNGYEVGTRVKIITGPLEGTEGVITSLDKKTGAVQIKTLFFGRETVVDQDFSDIERI